MIARTKTERLVHEILRRTVNDPETAARELSTIGPSGFEAVADMLPRLEIRLAFHAAAALAEAGEAAMEGAILRVAGRPEGAEAIRVLASGISGRSAPWAEDLQGRLLTEGPQVARRMILETLWLDAGPRRRLVPLVLDSLDSADPAIRRAAARCLTISRIPAHSLPEGGEKMRALAGDSDSEVRSAAVRFLAEAGLGTPKLALAALELADSPNVWLSAGGLASLGKLFETVRHSNPDLAERLAARLAKDIDSKEPGKKHAAVEGLISIGGPIVDRLLAILRDDPAHRMRKRAAKVLGGIRERFAYHDDSLREPSRKSRMDGEDAGELEAFHHQEHRDYLERTRPALAAIVRGLIAALADSGPGVAGAAADALGYWKLSRIPEDVRAEYFAALNLAEPFDAANLAADLLAGDSEGDQTLGLRAIGELHPWFAAAALETLAERAALGDGEAGEGSKARRALAWAGITPEESKELESASKARLSAPPRPRPAPFTVSRAARWIERMIAVMALLAGLTWMSAGSRAFRPMLALSIMGGLLTAGTSWLAVMLVLDGKARAARDAASAARESSPREAEPAASPAGAASPPGPDPRILAEKLIRRLRGLPADCPFPLPPASLRFPPALASAGPVEHGLFAPLPPRKAAVVCPILLAVPAGIGLLAWRAGEESPAFPPLVMATILAAFFGTGAAILVFAESLSLWRWERQRNRLFPPPGAVKSSSAAPPGPSRD